MEMKNKQELRQEAVRRLTEEVRLLIRQPESEQLHWRGSRLDLMEALYEVFLAQELLDDEGMPMPFMRLVRRACAVLHLAVPRNPYDCAARGRSRKGFLRKTFMERYQYMLQTLGNQEPLWEEIY